MKPHKRVRSVTSAIRRVLRVAQKISEYGRPCCFKAVITGGLNGSRPYDEVYKISLQNIMQIYFL